MGRDRAYQQLWRVVDGAVRDCFRKHGDYLTPKGRQSARRSVNKRVVGTVLGFALQEAARQRELAVTDDRVLPGDHQAAGTKPVAEAGGSFASLPIHGVLATAPKHYSRYRFAGRFANTTAALQRLVERRMSEVDHLCFEAIRIALDLSRKEETEEVLGRRG